MIYQGLMKRGDQFVQETWLMSGSQMNHSFELVIFSELNEPVL